MPELPLLNELNTGEKLSLHSVGVIVSVLAVLFSCVSFVYLQDQRIALNSLMIQELDKKQDALEKRLDEQNQLQDQMLQHYEDNIDAKFNRVFDNQKDIFEQMDKK